MELALVWGLPTNTKIGLKMESLGRSPFSFWSLSWVRRNQLFPSMIEYLT